MLEWPRALRPSQNSRPSTGSDAFLEGSDGHKPFFYENSYRRPSLGIVTDTRTVRGRFVLPYWRMLHSSVLVKGVRVRLGFMRRAKIAIVPLNLHR